MTCAAGVALSLFPFGCKTTQHSSNYQFVVVVVVIVVAEMAFGSLIAPVPCVGHTDQVTSWSVTTQRPLTTLQLSGGPLVTFHYQIFLLISVGLLRLF